MRHLKIITKNTDHLHLEGVQEEFKFVEQIARRYAISNEELKKYYLMGVAAAEKFKLEMPKEHYNSKVAWIVNQTIKQEKLKRQ